MSSKLNILIKCACFPHYMSVYYPLLISESQNKLKILREISCARYRLQKTVQHVPEYRNKTSIFHNVKEDLLKKTVNA